MKKVLIIIFITSLSLILLGCGSQIAGTSTSAATTVSTANDAADLDYCEPGAKPGVWICQKVLTSYFDTSISLKLYIGEDDAVDIESAFQYFENTIAYYNRLFDNYNEYDGLNNVDTINHASEPVNVDDALFNAIKYVIDNENVNDVEGIPLFNIALGPVLSIWHDARESSACDNSTTPGISICPVPRDEIDDHDFNIDPNDIILDETNKTVGFAKPDMSIDLGGFAKGYVTEIIAEQLDSLGLSYVLNAGNSNVRVGGFNKNRDSEDYIIALIKPSTTNVFLTDFYQTVAIRSGMNLVTSGDYQRFFIGADDNQVYHHIINPYTLYPGGECMSVTVLYDNAAMADILSTAIYLMPLAEAKTFVENYPGLEAIWYLYDGTYDYSSGFGDYLRGLPS